MNFYLQYLFKDSDEQVSVSFKVKTGHGLECVKNYSQVPSFVLAAVISVPHAISNL